jgi:hypothetical protein
VDFKVSKTSKQIYVNFSSLVSTQTESDKFLTFFQEKFKIFLRKFQNVHILTKNPNRAEHLKRHLLPKFEPSSIFTEKSKMILIFLLLSFLKRFKFIQNSECEVHQSSIKTKR